MKIRFKQVALRTALLPLFHTNTPPKIDWRRIDAGPRAKNGILNFTLSTRFGMNQDKNVVNKSTKHWLQFWGFKIIQIHATKKLCLDHPDTGQLQQFELSSRHRQKMSTSAKLYWSWPVHLNITCEHSILFLRECPPLKPRKKNWPPKKYVVKTSFEQTSHKKWYP